MLLSKLTSKKNLTVLGLNSGTSVDSLDLAVVKFTIEDKKIKTKYISGREYQFPPDIRKEILNLSKTSQIELNELIYFDNILGRFFGQKATKFIKMLEKQKIKVDLIASHGQTVRHLPQKVKRFNQTVNGTLQLGLAENISVSTGKVVVSDFRQADIALGGEGAPITTPAVFRLFGSDKESRLIVNIGGIANYFYFPTGRAKTKISAADCGPGNCLSDMLADKLFGLKYDRFGSKARKGMPSERLLTLLYSNEFFKNNQKSTGRELFTEQMADDLIAFGRKIKLNNYDLMATAMELTARSIVDKIRPLVKKDKKLKKLYLTGGGRKNIFLLERIKHQLPDLIIAPVDELGIPGDYLEAVSYAMLGMAAIKSIPMAVDVNNRKRKNPVLGKITQPPQ